jgi:transcriptional regulator with XRE-family HTH domain
MRYEGLAGPLRRARLARGLTQAQLAERSGASRVTIARLEGGGAQDARLGTVAAVCGPLGLELRVLEPRALEVLETRLARERERAERIERRRAHAALAARLLALRRRDAARMIRRARAAVDRWQRDELCSEHYVSRWRAMLRGGAREVARALLDPGPWRDALFQNTPWSFALEHGPA